MITAVMLILIGLVYVLLTNKVVNSIKKPQKKVVIKPSNIKRLYFINKSRNVCMAEIANQNNINSIMVWELNPKTNLFDVKDEFNLPV